MKLIIQVTGDDSLCFLRKNPNLQLCQKSKDSLGLSSLAYCFTLHKPSKEEKEHIPEEMASINLIHNLQSFSTLFQNGGSKRACCRLHCHIMLLPVPDSADHHLLLA